MFDIKEYECITTQEKLLYNLTELLKGSPKPIKPPETVKAGNIGKCSVCGREWANTGDKLACARKHKGDKKK